MSTLTDDECAEMLQDLCLARQAVETHLQAGLARISFGAIDCPCCGGSGTLKFGTRLGGGTLCAGCDTDGCVSWIE